MMRDQLPDDLQAFGAPPGPALRSRLIPALNPCWRLWMREEGPLELVCLAQIGLELWSVQTDGTDFYFCHNRMVRKLWPGCVQAMRRDIHSVRGGFVRDVRIHLGEVSTSTAVFGRERPARAESAAQVATLELAARGAGLPLAAALADEAAGLDTPLRPVPAAPVQVSYRRRRHVVAPAAALAHA